MQAMSDYQGRFYNEVFFPYLDKHDIKHIENYVDSVDFLLSAKVITLTECCVFSWSKV